MHQTLESVTPGWSHTLDSHRVHTRLQETISSSTLPRMTKNTLVAVNAVTLSFKDVFSVPSFHVNSHVVAGEVPVHHLHSRMVRFLWQSLLGLHFGRPGQMESATIEPTLTSPSRHSKHRQFPCMIMALTLSMHDNGVDALHA